jgi:D-alanyl-D-alanine carboxypeptidase/D-alanyl-D-alanine-endopeptidase (penicillin-binding protein 4)
MLKSFGKSEAGVGSTAHGAREVRAQLAELGVDVANLRVTDGSGLSRSNRISATQMGSLLNIMDKHPVSYSFKTELAVSGGRGTLENRLKKSPYRGRVFAKTGTLNSVSALSGYTTGVDGRNFGFVTLMNTSQVSKARGVQNAFAAVLVK